MRQAIEQLHSTVEVASAKEIDYRELERLLEGQQWYEADQETWKLMLKVTNQEEEGWLDLDSIKNFPCDDLLTLDRLWVEYSKKHGFEFGFSVQKQIYVECGGKLDFSYPSEEIWDKFCNRTAWKSEGNWVEYPQPFFENSFLIENYFVKYSQKLLALDRLFNQTSSISLYSLSLIFCRAIRYVIRLVVKTDDRSNTIKIIDIFRVNFCTLSLNWQIIYNY